jgi:hypothetical protein
MNPISDQNSCVLGPRCAVGDSVWGGVSNFEELGS